MSLWLHNIIVLKIKRYFEWTNKPNDVSEYVSLENPKQHMHEIMDHLSDQYGLAYIKCAVTKREDGEQFLYLADVKIQHKDDDPISETVHRYKNVTLAVVPLTLDELKILLEDLSSGTIRLKPLGRINAKNSFEQTHYHISSRTHYAGYYNDWPSHGFRASLSKEGGPIKDPHVPLIKPKLPAYPSFFEACNVFFQHEQSPNQYDPIVINFLIPDYGARISVLEIAENQISVSVERKELPLKNLAVKIFCTKPNSKHQNSKDLKFTNTETVKFSADFVPDHVFVYLIDLKSGKKLDSKYFGSFHTDKTDGIVVKTSVEKLNDMLAVGESQHVEFKLNFDKTDTEFLETVVSFANTNDGIILLGVNDDGRVVGFYENFDVTDKKIRGLISGRCEPDIEVSVEHPNLDGRPIIAVKIKEGKNKPYLLLGKSAYKRVEKDDRVFRRLDFEKIFSEKQNVSNYKNPKARVDVV